MAAVTARAKSSLVIARPVNNGTPIEPRLSRTLKGSAHETAAVADVPVAQAPS